LETGGFSTELGDFSLVHLEEWGYLRLFATETSLTTQVHISLIKNYVVLFQVYPRCNFLSLAVHPELGWRNVRHSDHSSMGY
jgi:hypothetical protein